MPEAVSFYCFSRPGVTSLPLARCGGSDACTYAVPYPCARRACCLRRYCECFAAGRVCSPECHCAGCNNSHDHDTVRQAAITQTLERNPNAFKPKIQHGRVRCGVACLACGTRVATCHSPTANSTARRSMRNTRRGAIARNQVARRSTASASRPVSHVATTASAWYVAALCLRRECR